MLKFRKKPVVIEAMHMPKSDLLAVQAFAGEASNKVGVSPDGHVTIYTTEGVMVASPGDWIIKGVEGEIYPCKPSVFRATYEPVEGDWVTLAETTLVGFGGQP